MDGIQPVTRRAHTLMAPVLLAFACGPSGTGPSTRQSPPPPPPTPALQAAERGPCSPISDVAGHRLVWCSAYGSTCASASACDFIDPDGESRGPADPPDPAPTRTTRLTVFLRGNCEGVADSVEMVIEGPSDRLAEGFLFPAGHGITSTVSPGEFVFQAISEQGVEWKPFHRSVPAQGLVQRLTCR